MAVSESYLTYLLEQLAGVRNVVTKRMFGGVGIYSDGAFFAVIDNDTLFFKVDDALRPRYRAAGMPAFAPASAAGAATAGQAPRTATMEGYYQVPPGVLEDADELARWAKQSIALAGKKLVKKPVRRVARKRK